MLGTSKMPDRFQILQNANSPSTINFGMGNSILPVKITIDMIIHQRQVHESAGHRIGVRMGNSCKLIRWQKSVFSHCRFRENLLTEVSMTAQSQTLSNMPMSTESLQ
jgi:hypothetical protein